MQAASAAFGTLIEGNDAVVEHACTISLPLVQRNLSRTPSFDTGLGLWNTINVTAKPDTAHFRKPGGTRSMRVDWPTQGAFNGGPYLLHPDAQPGTRYGAFCWVWLDTNAPPVTLVNLNGGGNTVSAKGSWQLLWGVTTPGDPSPFGTIIWIMATAATTAGAGVGMWVDQAMFFELPAGNPTGAEWFDGDTAQWFGPRGASVSVRNIDPYPDATPAIESITITRQVTTDMAPGQRLIDGYMTASATVVLSGLYDQTDDSKTMVSLFDPDNTASPLWGIDATHSPVTIDQGVYTGSASAELLRQFTGYVDDCVVDYDKETVQLTCLDGFTLLRPEATIPSVAFQSNELGNNPGLTGGWVLDYLLRSNGIYSSPPPRSGCLVYASMHGSAWPEVAGGYNFDTAPMNANMSTDQPQLFDPGSGTLVGKPSDYLALMAPGQWSQQCVRNPTFNDVPTADAIQKIGNDGGQLLTPYIGQNGSWQRGLYFEGWLNPDASQDASTGKAYWQALTGVVGNYLKVKMLWSPGAASVTFAMDVKRDSGTTLNKAITGTMTTGVMHHVSCLVVWTGSTTATVTLNIDNTITTTNVTGLVADGGETYVTHTAFGWLGYADTVQITSEANALPYASTWTPTAILDASLNALMAIPDLTGDDPKTIIEQLAEAERGFACFDENGIFQFRNRYTMVPTTSGRTITSKSSLKSLASEMGMSTVGTHVQATATPFKFAKGNLWQAQTVITVPRLGNYTTVITLSTVALSPQAVDAGYNTLTTPNLATTFWRAVFHGVTGMPVTSGITVTTESITPTSLRLTIYNSNPFAVSMVSPSTLTDVPAGTPYLFIGGVTATPGDAVTGDSQWPPLEEGGAATNIDYGEVLLQINGNKWLQDGDTAQLFADDTLADVFRPRAIIQNMHIVADPRLQLCDRQTINDTDGSLMADDVLIVGLTLTDSATDYSHAVDARRLSNPGDWIMGVAGRSELGTSTYT